MAIRRKLDFAKIGMKAVGLGAGGVATKVIDRILPNLNPKIRAIAKVAIGALAPPFIAPRSQLVEHIGDGMITAGVMELAGSLIPGLAGFDDTIGDEYIIDEDYSTAGVGADEDDALGGIDNDDNVE